MEGLFILRGDAYSCKMHLHVQSCDWKNFHFKLWLVTRRIFLSHFGLSSVFSPRSKWPSGLFLHLVTNQSKTLVRREFNMIQSCSGCRKAPQADESVVSWWGAEP